MSKNDFRKNASEFFISSATDKEDRQPEQTKTEDAAAGLDIPRGYVLQPEPKSSRMQLLVQPSTVDAIKAIARDEGTSMNELVNQILKEYIDRREE